MKVKCINNEKLPCGEKLTVGKEYEVIEVAGDHYLIENDNNPNRPTGYMCSRFEVVTPDLEEQLQTAKNKVQELEAQIEAAKPKVGQKYKHSCGAIYMICVVNGRCVLICIENDPFYLGCSYTPCLFNNAEEVFGTCERLFTLVP